MGYRLEYRVCKALKKLTAQDYKVQRKVCRVLKLVYKVLGRSKLAIQGPIKLLLH